MSERPNLSLLLNMNLGFWGMQIGNGLQTANASAIFEALGAEVSQLPLLWLGAPVTGLLVQPLVGELSDRTWSRWGRRQPYFLGGALLGTGMLVALPFSSHLWQAVTIYWLLQLGLNISLAPARPFVGDLLAPAHCTLGYALQGMCIGLGTICASGLPWVLEHLLSVSSQTEAAISPPISGAYLVGALVVLTSTLWTFWTIEEPSPHPSETGADPDPWAIFRSIAHAVDQMPPIMRQLAGVQALTWAGI